MLRFIIKREIKDGHNGLVDSGFETVDIDVPELERILLGGGFSDHSYDHRALAGVEILPAKRTAGPDEWPTVERMVLVMGAMLEASTTHEYQDAADDAKALISQVNAAKEPQQ